jgi:hypothetical protein
MQAGGQFSQVRQHDRVFRLPVFVCLGQAEMRTTDRTVVAQGSTQLRVSLNLTKLMMVGCWNQLSMRW